jgi:DNA excision repair protein ERCC-4
MSELWGSREGVRSSGVPAACFPRGGVPVWDCRPTKNISRRLGPSNGHLVGGRLVVVGGAWARKRPCGVVQSVDCSPDRGLLASPPEPELAHAATRRHQLRVDFAERNAVLLDLVRKSEHFAVQLEQLEVGDYVIDSGIIIERKTYADFATSLVDGRLFPQAAALARSPHRPVLLLEGPRPSQMPHVHPHALKGAIVSLAVMWRIPVIHARDPEDAFRILGFLAQQLAKTDPAVLKRYDRKPKRLASRKLYVLQGLPGVGPALANRLLLQFGSVEAVMTAGESMLTQVRGIGPQKARRIRKLLSAA